MAIIANNGVNRSNPNRSDLRAVSDVFNDFSTQGSSLSGMVNHSYLEEDQRCTSQNESRTRCRNSFLLGVFW